MRSSPPSWVDPMMRVGYAARGVVYVLVGTFAFLAATGGGATPDSKSALASLLDMPLGTWLLALVALGLIAYSLWGFINSAFDLDSKGDDAKGWAARAAQFISGAVHLTLAVSVASLAFGRDRAGGDQNVDHWTAVLMEQPFGRWLVALVGIIALAIGVQHFVKAYKEKYKERMRYTHATERLDPVLKLGLAAHGLVVLVVGSFFLWSAWTADPSRAGGMREALTALRDTDGGQILFAVVALGLLGFAVYCFIEAAYRIVPRCAPKDLETLASKAREMMPSATSLLHR
jgi:uncharacterized membrane protein